MRKETASALADLCKMVNEHLAGGKLKCSKHEIDDRLVNFVALSVRDQIKRAKRAASPCELVDIAKKKKSELADMERMGKFVRIVQFLQDQTLATPAEAMRAADEALKND